tara:strand:- start:100 stop:606 length:507 start_codon:yes stop_codon:yes gene_type:complete
MCAIVKPYSYVKELDLVKYQGTWYEVYDDIFDETFQKGGTCVTANYKLNSEGTIDVLNREVSKNNKIENITGKAYYDKGNSGGELTVDLNGAPYPAPYWVVELGPIVDNLYDYSIVSDNHQISLFVLTRHIDRFFKLYDQKVLNSINDMGFTKFFDKPKLVNQTDCPF